MELKREKGYRVFLLISLGIFSLLYLMTLDLVGLPLSILKAYVPALVFAVIGISLYRGDYGRCSIYGLGLLFLVWYVFTRIILSDYFLGRSFVNVVDLCVLYGFALPFAKLSGDGEKRRILDIFSLVYVVIFGIIAWISIVFAITGTGYTMPLSRQWFGLDSFSGRLQILGQNANPSAALMALGFFIAVYLLVRYRKRRWCIAPAVLALIGFYGALALTDARASIVAFLIAVGLLFAVIGSRIRISSPLLKGLVIAVMVVAGMLISHRGFGLALRVVNSLAVQVQMPAASDEVLGGEDANAAEEVVVPVLEARDLINSDVGLSGREDVYMAVIPTLRDNPSILLYGDLENSIMSKIQVYSGSEYLHMHNAFLQVLVLTGIPGLLFALWLTIRLALATLKLLFGTQPLDEKMLPMISVVMLVSSLVESYVFVPWMSMCWSQLNFVFLLFSGYLLETGDRYRFPARKNSAS